MPAYRPRFATVEAHELATGDYLLVTSKAPPLTVPALLFGALYEPETQRRSSGGSTTRATGRRAAGGGRRAAGGGRPKKVRHSGRKSTTPPDYEKAVARCLKGEKVSAVVRDFPGMTYGPLWARVRAAKNGKVAHQHGSPAPGAPAKKTWV